MPEGSSTAHLNRILVVDDTSAQLQLLTRLLRKHGYVVHPASDGEVALEFVRSTLPDLILLDVRMPGMDGYEVCRRLKAEERTRTIPIIFVSILEDERDKVQGFQEGAVDFITKPFQPEEVLARIRMHLRLRELTERLEHTVAARTAELEAANAQLRIELAERRRAEEALHRLNRELRAVSNCNQALVRAEDERSLLEQICRLVCDEAGYRMAFVGYAEEDSAKTVRLVAHGGFDDGYFEQARLTWAETERGRGPVGTAIRTGRTDWVQDIATEPRMEPWRASALERGYRSVIALPLKDQGGRVFGVLLIYSSNTGAFTSDEVRLLEDLVRDLAYGIQAMRDRNARRDSEQRIAVLSSALDSVREAAFLIDERSRFHYVNEEACKALGYARDELLARGVPDIDPDVLAQRWPHRWAEVKRLGSHTFEAHHRTRDGRIFPVEITANYLEYAGRGYVVALSRDITERKRSELEFQQLNRDLERRVAQRTADLEATNQELETFSYSVSHDLRAPLRAITGYSQLLVDRYRAVLDPRGQHYLESISSGAVRMGRLIDDLLVFSRMSRTVIGMRKVDMTALAAEVFTELRSNARDRDIRFVLGDLPPAVCDRAMIRQVWSNLLDNAIKYTAGRATATIGVSGESRATELVYSVSDDGAGFDMRYSDKLFGVFQRLHSTEQFEGTGIGLAIVRRVVGRHGGRTWAEGAVDSGATFHFSLPCDSSHQQC